MQTKSGKVLFLDCYQTLLDVPFDTPEGGRRGWEKFVSLLRAVHGVNVSAAAFAALVEKRKADFYSLNDKKTRHHDLCLLVCDALDKDLRTPLPKDEVERLIYEYRKACRGYVDLYPKAADTLAILSAEYTLAIASYAQRCFAQPELQELGIEQYVSYFVFSSDISFRKHSPEFYRECLRLVQKDPGDCVMIGDNYQDDITVPASIGMRTVWIKNPVTFSSAPTGAHAEESLELADFDQLPQVIERVLLGYERSARMSAPQFD